jgi:septal ring factor EnvC (AmiA/AmiB activator)
LEVRLDHVSKNIVELKRIFRNARGVYANLARQLDIAEAELIDIERNIRTIEVRHMRGELPLEAYKRSLAAYERRREKTEAAINGILLRIREETR